jgi:hypothetical protein
MDAIIIPKNSLCSILGPHHPRVARAYILNTLEILDFGGVEAVAVTKGGNRRRTTRASASGSAGYEFHAIEQEDV